jgi:esterase/lipase superfamily enzyme
MPFCGGRILLALGLLVLRVPEVALAQRVMPAPSISSPPLPMPTPTPQVPSLTPPVLPGGARYDAYDYFQMQQVYELCEKGRYAEAYRICKSYLQSLSAREGGSGSPAYSTALAWLALLDQLQGRYTDAERQALEALKLVEKRAGQYDDLEVSAFVDNLAQIYQAQQRFAEAEELYKRVLRTVEKRFGNDAFRVGSVLNNLAWLYQDQGRYEDAKPLIVRAIAIVEKARLSQPAELGRLLDTLGRVDEGLGNLREAEQDYRRALKILQRRLGTEHPELRIVRENLGALLKSLGRLQEAEPLLSSSLAMKEKLFGSDHPSLAAALTQLADLYRRQGQCARAEPLFVRALTLSNSAVHEVPVLFATDRKRENNQRSVSFGGDRAREISVGLAVVALPEKEQRMRPRLTEGQQSDIGRSDAVRRLALHCIEVMEDRKVVEAAVRRLGVSKRFPGQALVFVHGYNMSFENAVRRAAQISNDLKFDGDTFLFSWPSRNGIFDYFSDREAVDITADHFKKFLASVVAKTNANKVHFIAHSMGNMVLLRALEMIAREEPTLGAKIGEVIHAAPDVDPDLFAATVGKIQSSSAKLTLYASSNDKALWFSGWLRDRPRAGYIANEQPLIIDGVDTIDVTSAGTGIFALNHDVYSESPLLIADMGRIIAGGERPPNLRTKAFEAVQSKSGATYWRLRQQASETSVKQQ